jgi:hypothetical protein
MFLSEFDVANICVASFFWVWHVRSRTAIQPAGRLPLPVADSQVLLLTGQDVVLQIYS